MMKKLLSILSLLLLFIMGQEIMAATGKSVTEQEQTAITADAEVLPHQQQMRDLQQSRYPNAAPFSSNRVQLPTEMNERLPRTLPPVRTVHAEGAQYSLQDIGNSISHSLFKMLFSSYTGRPLGLRFAKNNYLIVHIVGFSRGMAGYSR